MNLIIKNTWVAAIGMTMSLCMPHAAADIDLDVAKKVRDNALKSDTGYQFVADLTTEVGPRLPGSEADARAVAWAKQRFQEMGFDKVWLEPVTFPAWVRGNERAMVVGESSQSLHITALGGSVGTRGELIAEVVEFESYEQLLEAPVNSLEGKIAFINKLMRKHVDGKGYGEVVIARGKGASVAASKGAVALLIRSIGTDSHRFPHTGNMGYDENHPKIAAAALSNPDADQLSRLLERGKVEVSLNIDAGHVGEYTSHNVIADIVGSEKPEEIVLVGGHLDSWDLGTGALDDGAGVAITTAAAHQLIEMNLKPKRTVRVVAFANEEQGLLGAIAYAKAHKDELKNHVVASESDFGAGNVFALVTKLDDEWRATALKAEPLLAPLGIVMGGNNATGGGPDIIPMAKAGVPVFRLKQDGTDYFDFHHTADDTLDKIDPEKLKQNIAAWSTMIYLFSNH